MENINDNTQSEPSPDHGYSQDVSTNTTVGEANSVNELKNKYGHIKGWGVDFNPDDEPNYPMKKYTGDDRNRLNYERPPLQKVDIEILRSTERPTLSAVFGTAVPPSGVSGMIRRFAYKFSESEYGHWLNLLLADRVNVIEGFLQDLGRGHLPNIFAEKGGKAEWKYNRKRAVKKVTVAAIITTTIIIMLYRKNKQKRLVD
ncbi:MAG: hypothetical protein JWP81_3297 [Ferruginibacter sp.]|nr:hypothetical protein [Ferruginibacter sp.]